MNPQEPNGALPPVQPNEPAPPPHIPSVVQIPGQEPLVVTPQQPVHPQHQPAVEHSPYEFIINPQKAAKAPGPLVGGSTAKRAMIFVGGVVVLAIVAMIVASLLKGGGGDAAPLVSVAQEQTELIRVASSGATTSSQETTQALALAVELSITSANKQLTTYAATNKIKLDPKVLGLKHSASADTQLASAQSNDTYDATLKSVLQNDLSSYSLALKSAYASAPGPKGKQLLSAQYDGAQLLIQQSKQ